MALDVSATSSLARVNTALRKAPLFFLSLLVITIMVLMWHQFGMERIVEFSAQSGRPYTAFTDGSGGGASTVSVRRVGNALEVDCQLNKGVDWPYCKLSFEISSSGRGLDLSGFDSVSIDMSYAGDGPSSAKLFLANFEKGWSKPGDWLTNKVNEIEGFEITPGRATVLPLDLFYVAGWWKKQTRPPLRISGMRLDNVVTVELVTTAEVTTGRHVLTLRALRFHGKLITKNKLLIMISSVWITSAMLWAALLSFTLRRELNTSKTQLTLLAEVNRALKLETEHLAGQAHHDPLTGVLNREGLRAELMATSRLMTDPVSVIFLDIDFFKRINDQKGHDVGDLVLRQFAATVTANIRGADRLVRWGGEEFLLLCPQSDIHQAAALAEKLRLTLMRQQWPEAVAVTASFGVAQHNTSEEISQVIKRADEQLYKAKNSGRNRVHADFQAEPGQADAIESPVADTAPH